MVTTTKQGKQVNRFLIWLSALTVLSIILGHQVFAAGDGKVLSDPNAVKGLHFHPEGRV
jgi:hypothetical protein